MIIQVLRAEPGAMHDTGLRPGTRCHAESGRGQETAEAEAGARSPRCVVLGMALGGWILVAWLVDVGYLVCC